MIYTHNIKGLTVKEAKSPSIFEAFKIARPLSVFPYRLL
jgi:hypothetical protein